MSKKTSLPKGFNFKNVTSEPYNITIEDGFVEYREYEHGGVAISIYDRSKGLYSIPTVNLSEYNMYPEDGNVFISDYSETEGIADNLIDMGVVTEKVRLVHYGPFNAKAWECKLP